MRLPLSFLFGFALSQVAKAYNASLEGVVLPQCLASGATCSGTAYVDGKKVTLPCAVASGKIPLGIPPLPLFFEGNYDLCLNFDAAHYCTIRTGMLAVPLGDVKADDDLPSILYLGEFRLQQCVSKTCTQEHLHASITKQVKSLIDLLTMFAPKESRADITTLEKYILDQIVVECLDKSKDGSHRLDFVGWFIYVLFLTLTGTMLVASFADIYLGVTDVNVIRWFSAKHNLRRLVYNREDSKYDIFNSYRVLSMIWVIAAHTCLNFVSPPITNQTAAQSFLQTFAFSFVRGAEYAVDTFFLMSGFLAAVSLYHLFEKTPLSVKNYTMAVISRYVRLTPVSAFCMFWYWKVLPAQGSGPHWNEQFDAIGTANSASCEKYWWTNLLFIQNLYPFNGPVCLTSTWYLANDFQFFLLAPFVVATFMRGQRSDNRILMYGPSVLLIIVQLVSTFFTFEHFGMDGTVAPLKKSDQLFFGHVYEKPWTRISPYAVGLIMAFFHIRNAEVEEKWKTCPSSTLQFLSVAALGVMVALQSAHYFQFRCEETDDTCEFWGNILYYGYFAEQNWSKHVASVFYSFSYLIWAVSLAVFSYGLICSADILKIRWLLSHPIWAGPARLTYTAYLIHLPLMFLFAYSQPGLPIFHGWQIVVQATAFTIFAYMLGVWLYLILEKPVLNMYAALISSLGSKKSSQDIDVSHQIREPLLQDQQVFDVQIESNQDEEQRVSTNQSP